MNYININNNNIKPYNIKAYYTFLFVYLFSFPPSNIIAKLLS